MIRGTSHEQDFRFADKSKKMLQESKWPDKYDTKIDLSKVDLSILELWVNKRVESLMGEEDDILTGTIMGLLNEAHEKLEKPSAKKIHIAISGFMTTHTLTFMSELWDNLNEAQKSKSGVPNCLIQEKKQKEEQERQKLQEIEKKKKRINSYKFKETIHRHAYRRSRSPDHRRRYESDKYRRKRSRDRQRSREKYRERSRSYSRDRKRDRKQRKHERRSEEKRRNEKYEKGQKKERKQSQSSSEVVSSDQSY